MPRRAAEAINEDERNKLPPRGWVYPPAEWHKYLKTLRKKPGFMLYTQLSLQGMPPGESMAMWKQDGAWWVAYGRQA